MASIATAFKQGLAALSLAGLLAAPAAAAEFSVRRGLNMDQWVTWPNATTWGRPGVLQPFPEWRKFVTGDDLRRLKASGLDFLRVPIDPIAFMAPETAGVRDRLYADVLETVRMINGLGLKTIVDMHLIHWDGDRIGMDQVLGDERNFEDYLAVIRRMGQTLAREPADQVALELMNEPGAACDAAGVDGWRDKQKKLFAAARSSATRLTLVLTGGCMSNAQGLTTVDPSDYPDDNLIWTFHFYEPALLTQQGATWTGDFLVEVAGLPYPPLAGSPELEAALKQVRARIMRNAPLTRRPGMLVYLDEQIAEIDTPEKLETVMSGPFDRVGAWAARHGVEPKDILVGEFGMIRQEYGKDHIVPTGMRVAYYKDVIRRAEKAGFAWSMWSYGGAFGIVDEFEGRKAEPDVLEMVKGLD